MRSKALMAAAITLAWSACAWADPTNPDPDSGRGGTITDGALTSSAGLLVVAGPGLILASPGGPSDPINVTITNTGPIPTPLRVTLEGAMGWTGRTVTLDELAVNGSVMIALTARAPGLAGAASDSLLISVLALSDGTTRGWASVAAGRRPCPGDWNGYGGQTVQDVFDFLRDYFRQAADFNGLEGTSVQDIFEFLAAYFDAC